MTTTGRAVGYGRPISLDGLHDLTIRMLALFVHEGEEDELERRLMASNFAARCGVLDRLRDELEALERTA